MRCARRLREKGLEKPGVAEPGKLLAIPHLLETGSKEASSATVCILRVIQGNDIIIN